MSTYDEVRKDWETLWAIAPADDMTGGYVDQKDLERMLEKPTKKTARDCMQAQIDHWFSVGPDREGGGVHSAEYYIFNNPEIRLIAEKYGHL